MTHPKPATPEQAKQLAMQWKRAAPLLEEQRERDIRETDTEPAIVVLDDAFEDALARFPPLPTSGMVEMQRYFMKGYRRALLAETGDA